jgi:hypothetical protein
MERCPICKARIKENTTCNRCGTDLSRLLTIESQAAHFCNQAIKLLINNKIDQAQIAVKQSLQLKNTQIALTLYGFIKKGQKNNVL